MGHVMQLVHAKISCYTPPLYAFLRASTPLPRCPRWTLKEIPRFIQGVQTLDRIERALNRCSQYRVINNKIFEIRIDQNPVFKDAQRDFLPKCNEFSTQNWNICTSICNQEYRGQDRVFKDTLKETEVFFSISKVLYFFFFQDFRSFSVHPVSRRAWVGHVNVQLSAHIVVRRGRVVWSQIIGVGTSWGTISPTISL